MSTAIARANKYAGQCTECGYKVAAGEGLLLRNGAGGWIVRHRPKSSEWVGSPVSGRFVTDGGCPADGEGETWEPREPRARRGYGGRGRRYASYVRCTHEDYPCCGCDRGAMSAEMGALVILGCLVLGAIVQGTVPSSAGFGVAMFVGLLVWAIVLFRGAVR